MWQREYVTAGIYVHVVRVSTMSPVVCICPGFALLSNFFPFFELLTSSHYLWSTYPVPDPVLYHPTEEFKIRVEERTTSLDWRRVEAVSSSFACTDFTEEFKIRVEERATSLEVESDEVPEVSTRLIERRGQRHRHRHRRPESKTNTSSNVHWISSLLFQSSN